MSDKIEAEIIDDVELDEDAELEIDDLDLEDIDLDEEVEELDESTYEFDVNHDHHSRIVKLAKKAGLGVKTATMKGPGGGNPVVHLSHKDTKQVHAFAQKHFDPDMSHEDMDEIHRLNEATAAADTLRPKGAPGESKAQTLATFVELLSQLGKEDLSHIHNQVQNQYGPNKGPGNHGDQATNRNTIKAKASDAKGTGAMAPMPMPKLMVREDVEEMFAGNELSEEFKDKASTIFEAALNTRINIELVKLSEEFDEFQNELHEEYEAKLAEAVEAHTIDLEQRLDSYLDHVTENWMAENALQIESTLRAELAESFIHSLKNVFEEHYVEVPEEKFDVIKEMREEIEELKTSLNRSLDENLELKTSVAALDIEATINDLSEGLTVTQASKLQQLSEGLEYSDSETFRKKLEIIKENYFNKKTPSSTGLITESIDGEDTTVEDLGIDPVMSQYAKAISKN